MFRVRNFAPRNEIQKEGVVSVVVSAILDKETVGNGQKPLRLQDG